MQISEISRRDFERFWPIFQDIVQAQESYAVDPNIDLETAYKLWCILPQITYIVEENGLILGSYYIKPNADGPSAHIANCGYMVSPECRGKGVARMLCVHSQKIAIELGFSAMQFNSVVSTNTIAINLWKKLGYNTIGTIPDAYNHKKQGFVDSLIMYKQLKSVTNRSS